MVNLELARWVDSKCERIARPPTPDSWRSCYGVFRTAAEQVPTLPGTRAEKLIALNALGYCAWSAGIRGRLIDQAIAQYKDLIPNETEKINDGK